jgi:hypothetical protein
LTARGSEGRIKGRKEGATMARSTLPLFPTDDGWPYPDGDDAETRDVVAEVDLDDLELRADPHVFDDLTEFEREALLLHFGMRGQPVPMKELGPALGCTRMEARSAIGSAVDKVRRRLTMT